MEKYAKCDQLLPLNIKPQDFSLDYLELINRGSLRPPSYLDPEQSPSPST